MKRAKKGATLALIGGSILKNYSPPFQMNSSLFALFPGGVTGWKNLKKSTGFGLLEQHFCNSEIRENELWKEVD